jgi:lipid-A-disaccharide synthase
MAHHIMIIAGETSGDALGADLMQALKRRETDVMMTGIGGPKMAAQGLASIFPMSEIAVMGLKEILPRLPKLFKRVDAAVAHALAVEPDVMVLIDSPEFNHRVAKRVKAKRPETKIICYVAPHIWAWRRGRARKMRRYFDAVMAFLPFEPEVFEANHGPPCHFVGHPIVDRLEALEPLPDFAKKYHLKKNDIPLAVLPGSRISEVKELVPVFGQVLRYLDGRMENLRPIIPLVPHMADLVREKTAQWPGKPIYVEDEADKFAAFHASRAALASSGTATMELALAGLPTVVAYNMGLMGDLLVRIMPVPSVVLVNLILDKPAMPEFLQERCDAGEIAPVMLDMLQNEDVNAQYRAMLSAFRPTMRQEGEKPADRAAGFTLSLIA